MSKNGPVVVLCMCALPLPPLPPPLMLLLLQALSPSNSFKGCSLLQAPSSCYLLHIHRAFLLLSGHPPVHIEPFFCYLDTPCSHRAFLLLLSRHHMRNSPRLREDKLYIPSPRPSPPDPPPPFYLFFSLSHVRGRETGGGGREGEGSQGRRPWDGKEREHTALPACPCLPFFV